MSKFTSHKELKTCIGCPFLEDPKEEELQDYDEWYLCCFHPASRVRDGELLCSNDGTPKPLDRCLKLTKYIHDKMQNPR